MRAEEVVLFAATTVDVWVALLYPDYDFAGLESFQT
jgi:hypothetical protein